MPVAGKSKQDVVSAFRCAEILEAARKVFARKGFNAATVDEITEAAGVGKGTLYLYFKSKREVYLAALKQGLSNLADETRHNVDAGLGIPEKIRAFISTRLRYAEENRDFVKIYQSEFGNMAHPACIKEFRTLYLQQAKYLETVLEEAVRRGFIRSLRADAAAFALFEMTRGVVTQRLLGYSKTTVEEDVETLFDMAWRGLAPATAGGKTT